METDQIILFLLLFTLLSNIRLKYIWICSAFGSGVDFKSKGSFIIQAKVMAGIIRPEASKILQKEVVPTMRGDIITNIVFED